jgi:hypothetical protein
LYGLGNLVENAVDFAKERVEIAAGLRAGGHGPDGRTLHHDIPPQAACRPRGR